jgi:HD-GYP domain-containing protein (c-di-GMP phosphodiesterase class II)
MTLAAADTAYTAGPLGYLAFCTSAREILRVVFAEEFGFWISNNGDWHASPFFPSEDDPAPAPWPADAIQTVCAAVAESCRPSIAPLNSGRCLLGIPVQDHGTMHAVAVREFSGDAPDLLLRLAEAFLREWSERAEAAQRHAENEALVEQVTQDFEELVFLRSVACYLDISENNAGLASIAEPLLLPLNDSVRALSLDLYETSDIDSPAVHVGKEELAPGVARRLIEQFGPAAQQQPVIQNALHQTADGADFPGVRQFLLVSVQSVSHSLGWLLAVNHETPFDPDELRWKLGRHEFGTHEASLLETAAGIFAAQAGNVELLREKEDMLVRVVRAMVSAIEAKDRYTHGHSERVALYSRCIARQLGYNDKHAERIYFSGLVHDLGKIGISDAVLNKPGRLTDEEYDEIKRHPDEGWSILHNIEQLAYVLPGMLQHHERYDGKGYPDGLKGDEISLDARIIAVADAYDAMTSNRPYRDGMPVAKADQTLREGAGTQWDADVVEGFFNVYDKITKIREYYRQQYKAARKPQT